MSDLSGHGSVAGFGIPARSGFDISEEHALRVAAVLDSPAHVERGGPLPALWHWAFGTPTAPTRSLGPDGHPALPVHGPSAGLPRRMWAGGRVAVLGPVRVGRAVIRSSSLLSAERKSGRSGELLVVTLAHHYEQDGVPVIKEEQDLVYRAAGGPVPEPAGDHREAAPPGGWADRVTLGPVALFRFSAVTFNAHRIHYDARYAAEEEGYPRPVVHGPLTALLLAESVRAHTGGEIAEFSFRASAPLFAELPFTLTGAPADTQLTETDRTGPGRTEAEDPRHGGGRRAVDLRAVRNDGRTAMAATAVLATS